MVPPRLKAYCGADYTLREKVARGEIKTGIRSIGRCSDPCRQRPDLDPDGHSIVDPELYSTRQMLLHAGGSGRLRVTVSTGRNASLPLPAPSIFQGKPLLMEKLSSSKTTARTSQHCKPSSLQEGRGDWSTTPSTCSLA